MKKICLLVICGALIVSIAGCGTVKGLGEDISTVGRWLIKGSSAAKK